jgi:hypothetical protein
MVKKEQILLAELTREKDNNEKLVSKVFVLENIILKKDNIIESFKKKSPTGNNLTYVLEPTTALTQIHDELEMYKKIYNKLTKNIIELKNSLFNYRKINYELELDLTKNKQELKICKMELNNLKQGDKKEGGMNSSHNSIYLTPKTPTLNRKDSDTKSENFLNRNYYSNQTPSTSANRVNKSDNNIMTSKKNNSILNLNFLKNYEDYEENNRVKKEVIDFADDWVETLKNCNITQQEFLKLSKNKLMTKLIDIIEYLYKLFQDKNLQIRILSSEIEDLNLKNLELNKDNIFLSEQQNKAIKNEKSFCELCNKSLFFRAIKTKGDTGMDTSHNNLGEMSNMSQASQKKSLFNSIAVNYNNESVTADKDNLGHHNDKFRAYYTNTLESVTSSEFVKEINDNILNTENEENYIQNFLNVKNIKHE